MRKICIATTLCCLALHIRVFYCVRHFLLEVTFFCVKMGPKKRKGKIIPPRDPKAITETETTFYELTLTDIQRKIDRLQDLTFDNETEIASMEEELEELTDSHDRTVTIMKESIKERQDDTLALEIAIDEFKETTEIEVAEYTRQIENLEDEYNEKRKTLKVEIAQVAGKLSANEEFKEIRLMLKQKYEDNEKLMGEEALSHKRKLYENSRKFGIAKAALQRNMEEKLFQLSTSFQEITEKGISASMHRMTRENIAIDSEMDFILPLQQKMYNEIRKGTIRYVFR